MAGCFGTVIFFFYYYFVSSSGREFQEQWTACEKQLVSTAQFNKAERKEWAKIISKAVAIESDLFLSLRRKWNEIIPRKIVQKEI
jgi:hypothetical protein